MSKKRLFVEPFYRITDSKTGQDVHLKPLISKRFLIKRRALPFRRGKWTMYENVFFPPLLLLEAKNAASQDVEYIAFRDGAYWGASQKIEDWLYFALRKSGKILRWRQYSLVRKKLICELTEYREGRWRYLLATFFFHSKEERASFELPAWAEKAVDISNNVRYINPVLAQHGFPRQGKRRFV